MKTPEYWDAEFNKMVNEQETEIEDPYSERPHYCYDRTYAYDIREKRLEIIKKIQDDAHN